MYFHTSNPIKNKPGESLAVQWFGLCTSNARRPGFNSHQGTRILKAPRCGRLLLIPGEDVIYLNSHSSRTAEAGFLISKAYPSTALELPLLSDSIFFRLNIPSHIPYTTDYLPLSSCLLLYLCERYRTTPFTRYVTYSQKISHCFWSWAWIFVFFVEFRNIRFPCQGQAPHPQYFIFRKESPLESHHMSMSP